MARSRAAKYIRCTKFPPLHETTQSGLTRSAYSSRQSDELTRTDAPRALSSRTGTPQRQCCGVRGVWVGALFYDGWFTGPRQTASKAQDNSRAQRPPRTPSPIERAQNTQCHSTIGELTSGAHSQSAPHVRRARPLSTKQILTQHLVNFPETHHKRVTSEKQVHTMTHKYTMAG